MPVYDWALNGWTFSSSTGSTNTLFVPEEWTTSATANTWSEVKWSYNTTINVYDNNTRWWPMLTQEYPRPRWQREELSEPARESARQREVARTAARDRADELLCSMLSAEQRESYRLTGEFIVIGSAGGVYRVSRGSSGNITWLAPDGSVGGRLCAHPDMREGWIPDQDVALAQLLALSTDEAAFVAKANVHAGTRPRVGV